MIDKYQKGKLETILKVIRNVMAENQSDVDPKLVESIMKVEASNMFAPTQRLKLITQIIDDELKKRREKEKDA